MLYIGDITVLWKHSHEMEKQKSLVAERDVRIYKDKENRKFYVSSDEKRESPIKRDEALLTLQK